MSNQIIFDGDLDTYQNGRYSNLINDMNTALHTIAYMRITILSDPNGYNFAVDNNNNVIDDRLIANTNYTLPYVDNNTGVEIDGVFTVTFNDGSTFTKADSSEDSFWYFIEGLTPFAIKKYE
jgi:hypothetical protein